VVGPTHALSVEQFDGPRWELALQLLQDGEAPVNVRGLVLSADPATAGSPRRLHVKFDCPFDPSQVGRASQERLRSVAEHDLLAARSLIAQACEEDPRLAAVVEDSGVVYEYVHRYGMGALLVASAGTSGDLSWR
jgi:hypothetical protein